MDDRSNADPRVISIQLSNNRHDKATAFHVEQGHVVLKHNGQTVLKHRVTGTPHGPHFWTNETDGPRRLRWTVDVEVQRHGKQNIIDRPIYHFTDQTMYERFQSECRNVDFVSEFVIDNIKFKGSLTKEPTVDCNVKIWRSRDNKGGSITLPVNVRGNIVQEELHCIWLDLKKDTKLNQIHITFKANGSKKSSISHGRSESFETHPTTKTGKLRNVFGMIRSKTGHEVIEATSSVGTRENLQPVELAPAHVLAKLSEIIITFKDATACLRFDEAVRPFTKPVFAEGDTFNRPIVKSPPIPGSTLPPTGRPPTLDLSPRSGPVILPPTTNIHPAQDANNDHTFRLPSPVIPATSDSPPGVPIFVSTSSQMDQESPYTTSPQEQQRSTFNTSPQEQQRSSFNTSPQEQQRSTFTASPNEQQRRTFPTSPDRGMGINIAGTHGSTARDPPSTANNGALTASACPGSSGTSPSVGGRLSVTPVYIPPGSPRLTPQEVDEQRKKFWYRQNDIAPIAKSARIRAESNRAFYNEPFQSKDELRLLHILPGRDTELKLELEATSLANSRNTYEALSYSWGPGDEMKDVILNERKPVLDSNGQPKKFKVSLHLHQALIRLRLVDSPRTVWIDAICINQSDVLEMNHQVPRMDQIYKQAKRTIIWITEFKETASLPTCVRTFPAEDDEDRESCTLCAQQDGSASEHGDLDTRLKRLLGDFHERLVSSGSGNAWYLRLWCVQEFHFSGKLPSVYLGNHAIGWSHFAAIFGKVAGEYGPMKLFGKLRDRTQPLRTMHDLCATTGAFKVSDPRDRIYSLLNMTEPHPAKVEPDYAKSILEVLEEVTRYLILESNLDVLLDRRADRSFGEGFGLSILPSYIPDLTQLQDLGLCTGPDKYRTGGNNPPDILLCKDDEDVQHIATNMAIPRVLKIKAMAFDRIEYFTRVHDYPEHETSPSGALIYNNFQTPGVLIRKIIETLHLTFEKDMMSGEFDRTPKIGRLILELVLEETRNHLKELDRLTESAGKSLRALYKRQNDKDCKYVTEEDMPDERRNPDADIKFIERHWERRTGYIDPQSPGRIDITKVLSLTDELWETALESETVRNDLQAAVEFENLFCYARRTQDKYYFSNYDYHQPMRRDVIAAKSKNAISELDTRFNMKDEIELHEYSDKARQRDFFRTKSGFVGLGPSTMQANDLVVIPYGASRPFILRNDPHSEAYTLVGEAVLPGVMHGQWIAQHAKYARYYKLK